MVVRGGLRSLVPASLPPCCTLNWPSNLFCISSSSSSPYYWLPSFWFSLCHSANAAIPSHHHSQRVYPGFLLPHISVVWPVEGSMSFPNLWSSCLDVIFSLNSLTCWSSRITGQCESYINVGSLIGRIVEFCYYQVIRILHSGRRNLGDGAEGLRKGGSWVCVSDSGGELAVFFGQLQVLPPILCVCCNLAHLLFRFRRGKNLSSLRRWVKSSCTSKRSNWVQTAVILLVFLLEDIA